MSIFSGKESILFLFCSSKSIFTPKTLLAAPSFWKGSNTSESLLIFFGFLGTTLSIFSFLFCTSVPFSDCSLNFLKWIRKWIQLSLPLQTVPTFGGLVILCYNLLRIKSPRVACRGWAKAVSRQGNSHQNVPTYLSFLTVWMWLVTQYKPLPAAPHLLTAGMCSPPACDARRRLSW